MLQKKYRLAKTKDIEAVAKKGQKLFTPILMLKFLPNKLDYSRVAVIVSKKVSNKAVIRNRIRRVLNEIIRLNFNQIKPGFDILILISPKIMAMGKIINTTEIRKVLAFILNKIA
jgi:ribonuclease P protein component